MEGVQSDILATVGIWAYQSGGESGRKGGGSVRKAGGKWEKSGGKRVESGRKAGKK